MRVGKSFSSPLFFFFFLYLFWGSSGAGAANFGFLGGSACHFHWFLFGVSSFHFLGAWRATHRLSEDGFFFISISIFFFNFFSFPIGISHIRNRNLVMADSSSSLQSPSAALWLSSPSASSISTSASWRPLKNQTPSFFPAGLPFFGGHPPPTPQLRLSISNSPVPAPLFAETVMSIALKTWSWLDGATIRINGGREGDRFSKPLRGKGSLVVLTASKIF